MREMDAQALANYIKEAKKQTPVQCWINRGNIEGAEGVKIFPMGESSLLIGDYQQVMAMIENYPDAQIHLEYDRRNSAVPLLNTNEVDARIEPGALIRDQVEIHSGAVIMMGAVINIGAVIGEKTMIDMNAVVGARGTIGKKVHVGAGAVVAGVLEPPSAKPVVIEDEAMIGANAVILEGVRVGRGAVVAAGAIVTEDVLPYAVVAGSPARVIKQKDAQTEEKTKIVEDLRD